MIPILLSLLPFVFAVAITLCRRRPVAARILMVFCASTHVAISLVAFLLRDRVNPTTRLLSLSFQDPVQFTILVVTSILFLFVALHACKWIPTAVERESAGDDSAFMPENIFLGCLAAFLGSMTLVILSRNFGMMWVAIEATTLLSAPLIIFHRNAESIEAMWKYMLICSVGIGFALFGTMLMAHSSQLAIGNEAGLDFTALEKAREYFDPIWFKAAFVFILAGYGTKMGLAPFHTWLPDAHSEAPAIVSALLSGSLLNCSFIAILRFRAIAPTILAPFCDNMMIALGLFSVAIAAIFIVRQHDFKRMLAYSSVEHMGLILILSALGSNLLPVHLFFHSIIKMALFLLAGNILLAYGTRSIDKIHGMFSTLPTSSVLWVLGILMICGMPPSPLFITEYALVFKGGLLLGGTVLFLLFVIFCGMTRIMISMTLGRSQDSATQPCTLPRVLTAAPLSALAATILLGFATCLWFAAYKF